MTHVKAKPKHVVVEPRPHRPAPARPVRFRLPRVALPALIAVDPVRSPHDRDAVLAGVALLFAAVTAASGARPRRGLEPAGGSGMRRIALGLVLALAVVVAPSAGAAGPTISYTVTSGTQGNNGWYTSPVTVKIDVENATDYDLPGREDVQHEQRRPHCSATDGQATTATSRCSSRSTRPRRP